MKERAINGERGERGRGKGGKRREARKRERERGNGSGPDQVREEIDTRALYVDNNGLFQMLPSPCLLAISTEYDKYLSLPLW